MYNLPGSLALSYSWLYRALFNDHICCKIFQHHCLSWYFSLWYFNLFFTFLAWKVKQKAQSGSYFGQLTRGKDDFSPRSYFHTHPQVNMALPLLLLSYLKVKSACGWHLSLVLCPYSICSQPVCCNPFTGCTSFLYCTHKIIESHRHLY